MSLIHVRLCLLTLRMGSYFTLSSSARGNFIRREIEVHQGDASPRTPEKVSQEFLQINEKCQPIRQNLLFSQLLMKCMPFFETFWTYSRIFRWNVHFSCENATKFFLIFQYWKCNRNSFIRGPMRSPDLVSLSKTAETSHFYEIFLNYARIFDFQMAI